MDDAYTMLHGKRSDIRHRAKEVTFSFTNAANMKLRSKCYPVVGTYAKGTSLTDRTRIVRLDSGRCDARLQFHIVREAGRSRGMGLESDPRLLTKTASSSLKRHSAGRATDR